MVSSSGSVEFDLREQHSHKGTRRATVASAWPMQVSSVGWSLSSTGRSLEDPLGSLNSILSGELGSVFSSTGGRSLVLPTAGMLSSVFPTVGTLGSVFSSTGRLGLAQSSAGMLSLAFPTVGMLGSVFSSTGRLRLIHSSAGRLVWCDCLLARAASAWHLVLVGDFRIERPGWVLGGSFSDPGLSPSCSFSPPPCPRLCKEALASLTRPRGRYGTSQLSWFKSRLHHAGRVLVGWQGRWSLLPWLILPLLGAHTTLQEFLVSSTCTLLMWPSGTQLFTSLDSGDDLWLGASVLLNTRSNSSSLALMAFSFVYASNTTTFCWRAAIWAYVSALCHAAWFCTSAAALLAARLVAARLALDIVDTDWLADWSGVTSSIVSLWLNVWDWELLSSLRIVKCTTLNRVRDHLKQRSLDKRQTTSFFSKFIAGLRSTYKSHKFHRYFIISLAPAVMLASGQRTSVVSSYQNHASPQPFTAASHWGLVKVSSDVKYTKFQRDFWLSQDIVHAFTLKLAIAVYNYTIQK